MYEQTLFKKANPVVKESLERVFGELEPVSKMNPDRFELPLTAIRRILGEDFYKMEGESDVLRLIVMENGGFNVEDVMGNQERVSDLLTMISMMFQGFLELNANNMSFSEEFMNTPHAKICITSTTKGLVSMDMCLNDLGPLTSRGADGAIVGLKYYTEIGTLIQEIEKTEAAIEQMTKMNNGNAIQSLQQTRVEYVEKLKKMQREIVEHFFEFIQKFSTTDNITDVYSVAMIVSSVFENDNPEIETINGSNKIVGTSVVVYHDGASKNIDHLKTRFRLRQ